MGLLANIKKIMSKPVVVPLPEFPSILIDDTPMASTLLFYGGNKLTEMAGNRLFDYPFTPPAFHAAFYVGGPDHLFLNVGKFREIKKLEKEMISTRRIDVVIYKNVEDHMRKYLASAAVIDVSPAKVGLSLPDYAWRDYLRFALRFLKPSKKDFCSENVVEVFGTQNVKVSFKKPVDTAPWDLAAYAMANTNCEIRTLWVGEKFKAS